MSLLLKEDFPKVSPLAVAIGAAYSHVSSFIIQRPVFGALYQKAKSVETDEQAKSVAQSEEAKSALASYGTSAVASAVQSYGVAALLKLTGTTTYKAASILGTLLFAVVTGPQLVTGFFVDSKPVDVLAAQSFVSLLDTVGLSLVLTWAEGGNPVTNDVRRKI